jgi:hypothetical protein
VLGPSTQGPSRRDIGWLLVGVTGLSACITLVFLGMRAVMDIGGACAEGGPYVSANPCPAGIALVMTLAVPAGFGFGWLTGWAGNRVGGYAGLPFLAWPALFISLGWNFLDYGLVSPPPREGIVWGWLIPGILFVLIGGVPLMLVLRWRREFRSPDGAARLAQRAQMLRAAARARASAATSRDEEADPGGDLVGELERLAALRARGDLSETEFEAAKAALIRDAGGS